MKYPLVAAVLGLVAPGRPCRARARRRRALARGMNVPARLAAAWEIHRFYDTSVGSLVDAWLTVETDERVRPGRDLPLIGGFR